MRSSPTIANSSEPVTFHEQESHEVDLGSDRRALVQVSSALGGRPAAAPSKLVVPSAPNDHAPPVLEPVGSGQNALSSVFTLCNSAIGAGVLSLPYAFRHAGLVGGVVLCLTIGSAEGFTLYVLSKFAERYKADTYGQLVRRSLGRKLTALLAGIQVTYLFGACVVYLIIMGDTFSSLGQLYLDPSNWLVQRDVIITGLGLGLLLPLCLLKKLGHLSSLSTLAVAGFMFTAGVVMYQGTRLVLQRPDHLEGVVWWKWDLGTLYAVPIITFGFNCHSNVVSIFRELTAEPDLLIASLPPSPSAYRTMPNFAPRPASHKLINMLGVIIGAMLVIQVGYICVGISGYLGYPHTVGSNILQSLPQDAVYAQVAQGLIGFVVLAHYPLSHFPARTGIHDVLHLLGFTQPLSWVYDLFTVLFVISSVAVARSVHSLGDALHLIGGTTASFMIFFLPGLMLINAAVMKRSNNLLDLISQDNGSPHAYNEPLLRLAANKGIKKTGLVYSPGKSWAAGIFLVALSLAILVLTVVTTLYKPHSE
ncbi:transmembrane amino acid transporter protein-domain-containing protein [Haematococcus lacustris]